MSVIRVKHELDRGVICEKCLHVVTKSEYKRVNTLEPVVNDSTGRFKTIDRVNLCISCYEKYKSLLSDFLTERCEL